MSSMRNHPRVRTLSLLGALLFLVSCVDEAGVCLASETTSSLATATPPDASGSEGIGVSWFVVIGGAIGVILFLVVLFFLFKHACCSGVPSSFKVVNRRTGNEVNALSSSGGAHRSTNEPFYNNGRRHPPPSTQSQRAVDPFIITVEADSRKNSPDDGKEDQREENLNGSRHSGRHHAHQPATLTVPGANSRSAGSRSPRSNLSPRAMSPMTSPRNDDHYDDYGQQQGEETGEGEEGEVTDWVIDDESGYLYSASQNLFFDEATGHYGNPENNQWYDPERDEWYADDDE